MASRDSVKRLEMAYQAQYAATVGEIRPTPDRIIERYRRCRRWWIYPKELMFKYLNALGYINKKILDLGCGTGEISTHLAKLGAHATAIDISPELIEIAKKRAVLDGVQDRIQFIAADIEEYQLPRDKFDCVVCFAVLHHVDIQLLAPLIFSWLKPGGTAIMVEPIAFSPLLQRIRNLVPVPNEGGPNDRQLDREGVSFILNTFVDSRATYFNLFGRLQRLFPDSVIAYVMLGALDRLLVSLLPFLSKFYGTVVIIGEKPIDSQRI